MNELCLYFCCNGASNSAVLTPFSLLNIWFSWVFPTVSCIFQPYWSLCNKNITGPVLGGLGAALFMAPCPVALQQGSFFIHRHGIITVSFPLTGSVVRWGFSRRMLCHYKQNTGLFLVCKVSQHSLISHILNPVWSPGSIAVRNTANSPISTWNHFICGCSGFLSCFLFLPFILQMFCCQ